MRGLPFHVVCWMIMALTRDGGAQEKSHYRVSCPLDADCLQLVEPVAGRDIQTMDPMKSEGIYPMDSVEEEGVQQVSPVEYEDTEQVNPVKDDGIQPLESLDNQSVDPVEDESSHVVTPAKHEVTKVFSHMKDQLVSSTDDVFTNLIDLRDEEPTSTGRLLDDQDTKIAFDLANKRDGHLNSPASGESHTVDSVDGVVADAINTIVKSYLNECHLVRFTSQRHSSKLFQGLSRLATREQPAIDVEGESLFSQEQPLRDRLRQGLWGKASHTCRALLLHLTNDYSLAFRFLEWSGVWQQPEVRVVVVGGPAAGAEVVLLHPSLRNTLHALYLSLHQDLTAQHHHTSSSLTLAAIIKKRVQHVPEGRASVWVYGRCLFCNNSEAGVRLLHQWNFDTGVPNGAPLFTGLGNDWQGHTFNIVSMDYFPYVDYKRNTEQLGTVVIPSDSLDIRMVDTFAARLNFTFVLREPWDRQWGVADAEGNWSGTVGTLQHERADFSLVLSPTASRMQVVDYSRIYTPESFVIISLKPQPLPQSLSLVRPFSGWLWTAVVACGFSSGLVLWLLQTTWSWVSGRRGVRLGSSVFYSWGLLLENPPFLPPLTNSGRVVVGWWLVSCLVICTAYRSSLVAHLTFPRLFPPINSFQDLLNADGWRWGRQPASGTSFTFFNKSSDPIVNKVFQNIEYHWLEEQLELVLAGRYSFLTERYYIKAIVAARFTDSLGYTPFHTSTTHYPIYAGISWGFRKGSPLRSRVTMMQQRLIEAGLIDYWMNHVINDHARRSRKERRLSGEGEQTQDNQHMKVEETQVVLGLHHLQGAFFLMFLGHSAGLLVWLGENLHHHRCCRRR